MKKTKLFTSIAALALVLSLGACTEVSEETTSEDTGVVETTTETETTTEGTSEGGTTSETTSEGGSTSGSTSETVPTTLSNYTLSIGIQYGSELVEVPEYATAYIEGGWDSWAGFVALTPSGDGRYEYTFSSIETGTYEYQLVLAYNDEQPGWTYRITQDGANASFTVKEEDGDSYKNEVTVTSSKPLSEIIPDPNAAISNVKVTIDITYNGTSQGVLDYGTLWIQGGWDSWASWVACSAEDDKYVATFDSLSPIEYEFVGVIYYSDEELPDSTTVWDYKVNGNDNAKFTVDSNAVSTTLVATKALADILPVKSEDDDDAVIAEAILDAVNDGISWDAFHGEYIDEGYDERETVYLTEDEDGIYGSIIDTEDDEVTFAYYFQDGKKYEYAANSSAYEIDDQWAEYSDYLDEYIEEQLDGAEDFDLDSDTYELKEYGDGYELIFTTDFMGYYEYEYIYIVDEDFNVTALAYGEYFAGDLEGWYAEETTYDKVETSMADFDVSLWADDEEEEAYLFGFNVSGTMYYIDGKTATNYNYEGTYTTDVGSAVRVSVEDGETAGEYYLSFELNGTTYWITIIDNSGYINLSYATEAAPLYWNATYSCWGDDTLSYFLCQNATYGCLYCSAISSWINSSPIALLYTEDGVAYTEGLVGYELPAPTKITVSGRETLYIGNTAQLSVTVEPANANPDVTWSSSNDSYATVSETGLVTGVGEGDVTITATSIKDTSVSGSIVIAVSEAPAGVTEVKLGTYDFSTKDETFSKANGSTSVVTTTQLKTTLDTYWVGESENTNPLNSVNSTNYIYQYYTSGGLHANEYNFLKTGTGSYNGTMELSLSETITKVEIDQQSWSTSENCTITVNDSSQQSASSGVQETLTFDVDDATSLEMTFAKRCYIFSITLYGYAA